MGDRGGAEVKGKRQKSIEALHSIQTGRQAEAGSKKPESDKVCFC